MRSVPVLVVVLLAVLAAGCDAGPAPDDGPTPAESDVVVPGLGPLAPDLRPSAAPMQAGPDLAGRALPSNQWWTSALTGPWTQPLWAVPVVARAGPEGLSLSLPEVRVEPDHVLSDAAPQLTVGGALDGVEVEAYGDFSVRLGLTRSDGTRLGVDLAQGSPVVHVSGPPGELTLSSAGAAPTTTSDGGLRIVVGGRTWEAPPVDGVVWSVDGLTATATLESASTLALAPRPDGAGPAWDAALAAATSPVTGTRSTLDVDRGASTVVQRLAWDVDGPGLVATTALQRRAGAADDDVLGTYETAQGELHVRAATEVELSVPLREPPAAVPDVALDGAQRSAVLADLRADLDESVVGGGIYDDGKALGRLALLADVAARVPGAAADELEAEAVALLGSGLRDWLTYDGAEDRRWLAHEPRWGTIAARPAQFGSEDLNDHHFHFGYLIRAAATLQRLTGGGDLGLDAEQRAVVDLLVTDVIGADALGAGEDDGARDDLPLPPFRVWNAYLGHSAASGFAPFGDGNNQESSSEAVQAWEAIAAWARVVDDDVLLDAAVARYDLESLAARTLWLGEGVRRPVGYDHQVVGIVWDGKLDFATFFDARPEAVIGIQLLPFTPGSTYRSDEASAAARVAAARSAGGGTPRLWPDLFLMDQAVADPAGALRELEAVPRLPIEAGNSRTWMRWWILSQQD